MRLKAKTSLRPPTRQFAAAVLKSVADLYLEVLGDFANQSSKRSLAKQQITILLVLSAKTAAPSQREGARGIYCKSGIHRKGGNHLISRSAWVPGRHLRGFFTPPVRGADFRAAAATGAFFGARPPVDLVAHCLVLWQLVSAR